MKGRIRRSIYIKTKCYKQIVLSIEPGIKVKTSFLTHMAYIIQKWHFTAIFYAFIDNTTFDDNKIVVAVAAGYYY